MIRMPHLPLMRWNQQDQLAASSRQVTGSGTPETSYYVYDAGGQRVRKVTERQDGSPKNERLYLGGFELYREYNAAGAVTRARETLHVMDDIQRIALVETTTIGGGFLATPTPALRYQLANHLGATSLELDDGAALISYQEYGPYGGATFQAGRSAGEVSLKRYRYAGKERDEKNGFTYHGARYYAPVLGRLTACDPKAVNSSAGNVSPDQGHAVGANSKPLGAEKSDPAADRDTGGDQTREDQQQTSAHDSV